MKIIDKLTAIEGDGDAISNIFDLEESLLSRDDCLHLEDMKYRHWFAPGLYGREITMPGDLVLTTMVHASEHIAFMLKGEMTIYSESGVSVMKAGDTMITKIGTKRAIRTHGEVVFTTVHANPDNETDVDKLVKKMTFNEDQYIEFKNKNLIEGER